MNQLLRDAALLELLNANPNLVAAWIHVDLHPNQLHVRTSTDHAAYPLALDSEKRPLPNPVPHALRHLKLVVHPAAPIRPLVLPLPATGPTNEHQACQNEPVDLGCQLQPAGAPWLGTAGLPVKWIDPDDKPHWGILSCWHVMFHGSTPKGLPQHQPTDARPPIAHLADWNQITENDTNYLDAAVADSFLDGFHTISGKLLQLGHPTQRFIKAAPGLQVVKSGRTTGLTSAKCSATGAAIKVDYGDFTATFANQDVFEDDVDHFSAPGDSGSAILGESCRCPCSLLFAGGGNLTIGNPLHYAIDRFRLTFPFSN